MTRNELINAYETKEATELSVHLANATIEWELTHDTELSRAIDELNALISELENKTQRVDNLDDIDDDYLIDYVKERFTLSDIYDDDDIIDYARDNMTLSDLFYDDDIIDYVRDNFNWEDVFDNEDALECVKNNYSISDVVEWQ